MTRVDRYYAGVRCRPVPFWRRALAALRRSINFYR